MFTKPTAPRTIGGVLDGSFSLWLPAFKAIWLLVLIPKLLSLVALIPQMSGLGRMHPGDMPEFNSTWLFGQVLALVAGLIALGFYNAAVARVDDTATNGNMTLGQSLSVGFGLWGRAFGASMLMGLAVIPLFVPMGMMAVNVKSGQLPSAGAGLFMLCYGLLLVFLLGRVFLTLPVIVLEDQAVWESINTSWRLTRGHWWRCAAIFTVLAIIAYVAFIVLGFVLAMFGLKNGLKGAGLIPSVVIATTAVGVVVSLLFTPLFISGTLAMYYDLKLRKEGGDLAGRVDALAPGKI